MTTETKPKLKVHRTMGEFFIYGSDNQIALVCSVYDEDSANALTRAVNAHDELMEAAKSVLECWTNGEIEIDPSVCVHLPNHTEMCPIPKLEKAISIVEGREVRS